MPIAQRQIELPSGETIPVLGQGTWRMAEDPRQRRDEVATLRVGIDLGMTLIDTAEMYADGEAESLVGEAIAGRRDEVFLVSKVMPDHASRRGTVTACEQSLRRLGTDRLDLYLLHWRGETPLAETVEAFDELVADGKIRHWGVSNLDVSDLTELAALPGGAGVEANQVYYNLAQRGIEGDLLQHCLDSGLPIMAYAPIEQGALIGHPALVEVAQRHGATPVQVAIAWVLRMAGVNTIPRAHQPAHVRENCGALDVQLTADDLAELDRAFPPPDGPRPLKIL
jgi:diketogulonate reductase-like aldo/keto reductase